MSASDREFYEERVHESRARAAAAADPKIAAIHMELATRYSLLSLAATLHGDKHTVQTRQQRWALSRRLWRESATTPARQVGRRSNVRVGSEADIGLTSAMGGKRTLRFCLSRGGRHRAGWRRLPHRGGTSCGSCGLKRGKVNPRPDERNNGPALSDVRLWPLADRQLSGAGPKKAEI